MRFKPNHPFADAGNSTCFRVLSDAGLAALRRVIQRIERHAVASPRIPRVLRGT